MSSGNGFTPTEKRILAVLSDGRAHKRDELHPCIEDELADKSSTLQVHISRLRKRLNPKGEDILCVFRYYGYYYQHVRLLLSANDGRT